MSTRSRKKYRTFIIRASIEDAATITRAAHASDMSFNKFFIRNARKAANAINAKLPVQEKAGN